MHWFQMFYDNVHYEMCPDNEFGIALFEKFRVEVGYYKDACHNMFGYGNVEQCKPIPEGGIRETIRKAIVAFKDNIADYHYFVDDWFADSDEKRSFFDKDRRLSFRFFGHVDLDIFFDSVPVYIYNLTEDGRIPADANVIDRLNLIINPDYVEHAE